MSRALEVDKLVKSYGRLKALDGMSLTVPAGCLAALVGPNGAGKSTMMRTIAGLLLPDEGRILVAGVDVTEDSGAAKRLVGLTPQELAMFDYLTAEETLRFVGDIHGVEPEVLEARIVRWLALTNLSDKRGRLVREFSGGMKRKLAVAAALVPEPPLVLLDESFAGLDPESTYALREELRSYCDRGGAVLLSSHVLDMVQGIADQVTLIVGGQHLETLDRAALDATIGAEFESLLDWYLVRTGKKPARNESSS